MQDPIGALDALLASADFAHLMIVPGDEAGEPPIYRLSFRKDGRSETAVAASLTDLLTQAAANPGRKECSRCGLLKPWQEFPRAPRRKDRPEGRHSHCKVCDRERKKKYTRARRRALRAAGQLVPVP